jgi:DNA-binding MarR family transcriptional regulator
VKLEQAIQSTKFKSAMQKAGLNVLYTAWWLKTLVSRELKAFGLTHEQYNVLRILKGQHPTELCVKNIACRMIEKNSNVPRIIDRLVVKKLVKRTNSTVDKRETVISLTAAGINILELANNQVSRVFDENLVLSEKEAVSLNDLLEKMRALEV